MRSLLLLGLAVVGVQLGCGADEADMGAQSDLASREDQLYICQTDSLTVFYSDATYTTEVGSDRCFCGSTPLRSGRRTPYAVVEYSEECLGIAPTTP